MSTVLIRATTFPVRYSGRTLPPGQYAREIREAISVANGIFSFHQIRVRLSSITHLGYIESMRLLSLSIPDEFLEGGLVHGRRSAATLMQDQLRAVRLEYAQARREGVWWGAFAVRRHPVIPRPNERKVTREALEILRLNRSPSEVATYWVPGFNNPHVHGETMAPWAHAGVTRQNEGIFMALGRRTDILAHELGHLLMRAGHCSFEGPNGTREGSAPPNNLMHAATEDRTGQDLTRGQIQRMLAQGAPYLR